MSARFSCRRRISKENVTPRALSALRITLAFLVAAGLAGASGAAAPTGLNGRAFPQAMERRETARATLEKVMKEAARWHTDAKLIRVAARVDSKGFSNNNGPALSQAVGVGGDGEVILGYPDGWNYTFSSPSAQKLLTIRLYFGGLATSEMQSAPEGEPGHERSGPLPPDFLDSDRVMAVARKSGFSAKGNDYEYPFHMQLGTPSDTTVKEPSCWQVTDDEGTSFYVSAKSGKLLAKVALGR